MRSRRKTPSDEALILPEEKVEILDPDQCALVAERLSSAVTGAGPVTNASLMVYVDEGAETAARAASAGDLAVSFDARLIGALASLPDAPKSIPMPAEGWLRPRHLLNWRQQSSYSVGNTTAARPGDLQRSCIWPEGRTKIGRVEFGLTALYDALGPRS